MHHDHESHSLVLITEARKDISCDTCHLPIRGFTYHCSKCNFNLDVSCALEESAIIVSSKDRYLKHECHEHSLILHSRPALFLCDACVTEDKDLPYVCPECPFWMHKRCANYPRIAKCEDHPHDLTLGYGVPDELVRKYIETKCNICYEIIYSDRWNYYCRSCRYLVHIKCSTFEATGQIEDKSRYDEDDLLDDLNFEKNFLKVLLDDGDNRLFCLPVKDKCLDLIGRFLRRKNSLAQIEAEITHWSHRQHPLVLFDEIPKGVDGKEEEILCDCCIEPILAPPYYSCVECNYILHLPCANLPGVLQLPTHDHRLTLHCQEKFYDIFGCRICTTACNGFYYECSECFFRIDVTCAALPISIKHEIHRHLLFQYNSSILKSCSVCSSELYGYHAYGCESCMFCLCYRCAMLPQAIVHRWDEHPLALTIPPYTHPSGVFYCVICEKEMDPKLALHHCFECDNSYHMDCVPRFDKDNRNIKFGGTIEGDSHQHPLKFVQEQELFLSFKMECNSCVRSDFSRAFECEDCNYRLCHECVIDKWPRGGYIPDLFPDSPVRSPYDFY